jgi:hypothetical protein
MVSFFSSGSGLPGTINQIVGKEGLPEWHCSYSLLAQPISQLREAITRKFKDLYKKKNSHFQSVNCTNSPANTLPPAAPIGPIAAKNLIKIFLIRPGGNVIVSSAIVFGAIYPAPIPVRPLRTQKATMPFVKPVIREKSVHHAPATTRVVLWP